MGRFKGAIERTGVSLPVGDAKVRADEIGRFLDLSSSDSATERQLAVRNLCTCHVQADDRTVGDRLLAMFDDPDVRVRREVLHALTDSAPAARVVAVVAALEDRYNEPDRHLRKLIRKTLSHYRRTGKITDAPR